MAEKISVLLSLCKPLTSFSAHFYYFVFSFVLLFWCKFSCSPSWPQTLHSPALGSWLLGLWRAPPCLLLSQSTGKETIQISWEALSRPPTTVNQSHQKPLKWSRYPFRAYQMTYFTDSLNKKIYIYHRANKYVFYFLWSLRWPLSWISLFLLTNTQFYDIKTILKLKGVFPP